MEENSFTGRIVTLGVLTRNRSVLSPSIIRPEMIKQYLDTGSVFLNHDWANYIAMPKAMTQQGREVWAEATFHSTPDVEILKQKCKERLSNGFPVGLSITLSIAPKGWSYFDSGNDLLSHLESLGRDLSNYDKDEINDYKCGLVFYHTASEILEYSLAPIPADKTAKATSMNSVADICEKALAGNSLSPSEMEIFNSMQPVNGGGHSQQLCDIMKSRLALIDSDLVEIM